MLFAIMPGFQIYQNDPRLPNHGGSYCWPSALAHRVLTLKKYGPNAFAQLKVPTKDGLEDPIEAVKLMAELCHTSSTGGTSQNQKLPCIVRFFEKNGLHPAVFSKDHFTLSEIEKLLRENNSLILHVAWLKFDASRNEYREDGSHSVNAYGFEKTEKTRDDSLVLQINNPNRNYENGPHPRYFDEVSLRKIVRKTGTRYPEFTEFELDGPGFRVKDGIAVLKTVYGFRFPSL